MNDQQTGLPGTPSDPDGVTPAPAVGGGTAAEVDPAAAELEPTTAEAEPDGQAAEVEPDGPAAELARPSRRLEVACATISALATGTLAFLARRIELRQETEGIDPRWWPAVLGLVGLALSVALLIVVLLRPISRDDLEAANHPGRVRLGIALALTVAFVVTWPLLGFLPTAAVFLAALTAVFGGRGWKALILFPVLTTAFIYAFFHLLLKVPL